MKNKQQNPEDMKFLMTLQASTEEQLARALEFCAQDLGADLDTFAHLTLQRSWRVGSDKELLFDSLRALEEELSDFSDDSFTLSFTKQA